jgi:8-oxo-dGTP pyrophosphatase MutT (NUDIX family)
MQKIFLRNSVLILTSQLPVPFPEGAVSFNYTGKKSLADCMEMFGKQNEKTMYLECQYPEMVLGEIKAMLKPVLAGGGVVKNPKEETLMIFRRGFWDLPKGKAEENETIDETALREVEEECAVTGLKIINKRCVTYHLYKEGGKQLIKETHWFNMRTDFSGILKPQTEEDIEEVKWMNDNEIIEALKKSYLTIKEVLLPA